MRSCTSVEIMTRMLKRTLAVMPLIALSSCGGSDSSKSPTTPTASPSPASEILILTSRAFTSGGSIPRAHTCDDRDASPALEWTGAPYGTAAFALLMDDPDASGWDHWALFNIPATTRSLTEGVRRDDELADGSRQGRNDFGGVDYNGPCPPRGAGAHRYSFRLYALDTTLALGARSSLAQIEAAMGGRILKQAELTGTYGR
jgi:Raf kinase inhibitor-like YbhB/YbcL family protein